MSKKAKFYQIYADLPLGLRNEILVVVNDEPMTWRVAWIEIERETKKGKQILDLLSKMEILK